MVNLPPVDGSFETPGTKAYDPLLTPISTGYGAQRQLLPNSTALQGENFLLTMPGQSLLGPKSVARVLEDAEPLPYPFEYVIAEEMRPVGGIGGSLGYVSTSPQAGTTCVLVAGSQGSAYGTPAAVVMRNCVNGDVAEALSPLRAY